MTAPVIEKKRFYCREWAFAKLAHCLEQRPASKSCGALIVGGPGSGKTALCAELAWPSSGPTTRHQRSLNRRVLARHFCQARSEPSLCPAQFVRSLVAQLLQASSVVIKVSNHNSSAHSPSSSVKTIVTKLKNNSPTNESHGGGGGGGEGNNPTSASNGNGLSNTLTSREAVAEAYADRLRSDPEIQAALQPEVLDCNPDEALRKAVLLPLLDIETPKDSLLLVVDSIDEGPILGSGSNGQQVTSASALALNTSGSKRDSENEEEKEVSRTIAELLANHHHLFPQWLLLVCTARRQSKTISRMFTGFRKIALDDLRKSQVVRDVQQYILARLDQEDALRQHISKDTAEMLNHLHIKSNGCFLYLEKVLDGVAENFIVLREVREIPGTLNGLYLWLCQRLFSRKQFAKVQPLLNIILAAKLPITQTLLYECVKMDHPSLTQEDFNRQLHLLRRVISVSRAGALMLFHHSFAEWLLDVKHCTQKYLCSATEGHAVLASYYTLKAAHLNADEICALAQHVQGAFTFQYHPYYQNHHHQHHQHHQHHHNHHNHQQHHHQHHTNSTMSVATLSSITLPTSESSILTTVVAAPAPAKVPTMPSIDPYTLQLLWLVNSGVPFKDYYLYSSECILWPKQDAKLMKLLVDAGVKLSKTLADEEDHDKNVLVSSSQISGNSSPTDESPIEPLAELLGENGDINQTDSCGRTVLHNLAADGNSALLALALEAYPQAKLEATDRHGQTALNLAARHGYSDVVKVLLSAGGNVDHADCDGWTALRAAAWGGHTKVVEQLLECGAMVDCADWDQRTALRAAAWGGHEEIVKALLQHGADVNRTDDEGRTALIAAAYMGHSEIVEHLLDYGAEIDHADSDGRTALSVAALCVPSNHGYAKVVSLLLERGADVNHQDKDGMTPLLVAAFEGHKDVCELLLEYEADVDHCDSTGRTPLWAAASMGHESVVTLLLFWGCYVDSIDNEGRTVLSVAAAQGCLDVVKHLVNRGLDEQHRDNSGWSPLHYAAFEGHAEVSEALLEAGAKINEIDNDGKSALMLAAQEGHTNLVERFLVQYRAPIDQHAHDGKTALRLAALEGHYDTVKVLLSHNADINAKDADGRSILYILALENRLAMARFLLEQARPDIESRDSEGRTALHVSAWQGHVEMVALLLVEGCASVNARDNDNRTPLHSAAWQGHAAIVRLLLEHGATPDHTCNQGATALSIAAQEGHESCVRALLNHGADPNHSDHCGRNAIKVAAKSGHDTVVRLLEEHAANRRCSRPGGSSSATSVTSNSTTETKPSSAVLNPTTTQYSPAESPDSTKRRSCVSLGNNSSNSKSSSNLTGSTKSDRERCKINPNPPIINQGSSRAVLSFTQQLQQCSRGVKSRPLSKLLSPLKSEPQSPIYASPPHSPLSDSPIPYSPTNNSPPSAQTAASIIQSQLGVSLLTGNQSTQYKQALGYDRTGALYDAICIKKNHHVQPIMENSTDTKPFELTNEMLGLSENADKKNGYEEKKLPDTHFTRDTHMRIILGNSGAGVGRNVKYSSDNHSGNSGHSKPKKNGLVSSNPAMRLVAGVRNGIENAANRHKPVTTRVNGFQWKAEARKETPL